jgi:hypothetical protein
VRDPVSESLRRGQPDRSYPNPRGDHRGRIGRF